MAALVPVTTAEGPHARFAVWVQGCTLGCAGCCNPQMLSPGGGEALEVDHVLERLDGAVRAHGVEGITVLGGEPLQQLAPVARLCEGAARRGLGVLVFTGHRLDEARELAGFDRLWRSIDTLVDGRFDGRQLEPPPHQGGRRFIGSRNQRLCHRSDRYRDPSLWQGPPRLEVHVDPDGRLSAHGEPAAVRALLRSLRATAPKAASEPPSSSSAQ